MAKKKNSKDNTNLNNDKDNDAVFDDSVGIDDVEEFPEVEDATDQINEILAADPNVQLANEEAEEKEEVLYCPNCGVTGLFVDNVCMNCGTKKSKKTNTSSDEIEDDMVNFDDQLNLEEF